MRKLLVLLVLLALVAGIVYVAAGRMAGPAITIAAPEKFVGAATPLDVTVESPGGTLSALRVVFEQGGTSTTLFALDDPASRASQTSDGGRVRVAREIGKGAIPGIAAGPARIVVTAARPVLYGMRDVDTTV